MYEMKKIIVSVINDLVTDHRVHKVCTTLHHAGYEVCLVGRRFRDSHSLKRVYKTRRMRLIFNKTGLFYAEYNIRLFFLLLFSKADIYLSNDTDTILPNFVVSKIKRKPLVFDAHEMFPEVPELAERKAIKAVWTKIEDWIFPRLQYCYTVCESIADIYNNRYGMNMQVVRNIPPAKTHNSTPPKRLKRDGKHILLYQGAVNVGRGIEWMIDAMPYLDDCIFYIAGKGDILPEIEEKIHSMQLEDRVVLLGQIPLEELPSYTHAADLGISLLANQGLNYYYSLPNRIFDFIRADVPVLATDFPEIRKIVAKYNVGALINRYEPQYLADIIKETLNKERNIRGFERAKQELAWENEEKVLLEIIEDAVLSEF